MKATTYLAGTDAHDGRGSKAGLGLSGHLRQFLAGLAAARGQRHMRAELAGLDTAILRDIGIGEDEIVRVRAGEDFVPRAWKT